MGQFTLTLICCSPIARSPNTAPMRGGAGTDDSEQKTPLVWVTDQPHQVRLFAGAPMGVAGGELTEVTSECH